MSWLKTSDIEFSSFPQKLYLVTMKKKKNEKMVTRGLKKS